ncbi:hypothetical protein DSL64_08040 [Dyadobacter luteus]|uniref:Uncharacterized protein n=1 Tax=Dyadobacter luteus TaxID=2259619 RepID=A0A3D8YEE0_9BACT|nr:hypothetical protein DSL64_08040 [Dyadobacter luteus]
MLPARSTMQNWLIAKRFILSIGSVFWRFSPETTLGCIANNSVAYQTLHILLEFRQRVAGD